MPNDSLKVLVCPDCHGNLVTLKSEDGELAGLACPVCELVFPAEDGILILLDRKHRNSNLETSLLAHLREDIQRFGNVPGEALVARWIDNTLNLLTSHSQQVWAWEDEKFWNDIYTKDLGKGESKNWSDRLLERKFLVTALLVHFSDLSGLNVLDLGAGEGQNFRDLLAPYVDDKTLYIATDISPMLLT